ncbi:Short-chain dehydrogenase/reductase [Erwinia billingiae Eb661]|uniref:Short-chain dehydrogenase/reductase n=1 Tax=Erwinia billingiae (strain Eb661) TaxID=634500 RepID=D8MMM9_ERWBE|nr:SDR family oxidoreductase [Erwinia billingiae]CAX58086.1 Short-chain dehydrogenase/reductase [Erwinia billingiae Eb661]
MTHSNASKGTAAITGASAGIGAFYAQRLAQRGYDLLLIARDKTKLEALAAKLSSDYGVKAEVLAADLIDQQDLARVEQRLSSDANITLLVNNAGMTVAGDFLDNDIDSVQRMIILNVLAPTRLAHAAANAFKDRKQGTIINIASVLSLVHEMSNGVYNGTKSFVLNFSRSLEASLQPHGVRVQAVLPGLTRTEIFERSGRSTDELPAHMLMEVDTMVDAALAGLDLGESVTIPSLEKYENWEAYDAARAALLPDLSLSQSASRYR